MTSQHIEEASHLWLEGQLRVFISHIARYKAAAAKFQSALQTFHISGFVAHSDIQPMREWEDEILLAARSADAMV
ncbi:MAG: toll/interleukin-1 receptor domain-containing protein, partial [Anaerolineales bacterium]